MIAEMEKHVKDYNREDLDRMERRLKHDVMAHIEVYRKVIDWKRIIILSAR